MKKLVFALIAVSLVFSVFANGTQDSESPIDAKEKVVFTRNNATEPQSLDPHHIEGVPEHNIYMCLFEGLVTYNPETLAPEPAVAERWESSEDKLTWTFYLRKDAQWSDGVPITAQTFVDSWLRFLSPETAAAYAYLPGMIIKGASEYNAGEAGPENVAIRAIDDHTFQFELVGPAPYALGMLAHYAFSCVPLHAVEKHGTAWIHPENFVGNGPFTLKNWIPHDKIVMTKNETYWDKENVGIDELIFFPIDDQNTTINMYLQGDIDWIEEVPNARLEEMKLRDEYHCDPILSVYYYQFNTTCAPFDDVRVRKAFSMAIDRQTLVDRVTRGGQSPAFGMVPPMANYEPVIGFEEDYEEAKRLLAEAGYPNGEGFPDFSLIYNTSEGHKLIAQYIQQQWNEHLNVECEIENQEWATFIDNRQGQNFTVARAGWGGDYADPNTFLQDLMHSKSGNNDGRYSNPEYDALLKKASLMPAGQERYDVLRQAEMIAIAEDQALMPIYHYTRTHWIDTDVWGGWYTNALDIHPYKFIYKK